MRGEGAKRRRGRLSEMDKFFASAYKGGSGPFANVWIGTVVFSVMTWISPYFWQLSTQFNWHDKAFLFEQYHWKKPKAKNQPYKFKWNQQHKEIKDSYYNNRAAYFP